MKAIGLMAGTSLDGIDAALVELKRSRGSVKAELLAFRTYAYSGETVRLILEASDPKSSSLDKVVRLNFFLGELFAEAALKIVKKAGIRAGMLVASVNRRDVNSIAEFNTALEETAKTGKALMLIKYENFAAFF